MDTRFFARLAGVVGLILLVALPVLAATRARQKTAMLSYVASRQLLLTVPKGTRLVVFSEGNVTACDAQGRRLRAERHEVRAFATTLHPHVDMARHKLLTEGPRGEIYLSLPAGAARVRIDETQELNDGRLVVVDSRGRVLASETNTDFRMVPLEMNPLACATSMVMISRRGRDEARFRVPPGTRCLHLNGAEMGYDGSVLALDGHHRALALQSTWTGNPEVRSYGRRGGSKLVHGDLNQNVAVRVVYGTRTVVIGKGYVRLLDAYGRVLAEQKGLHVLLHERG